MWWRRIRWLLTLAALCAIATCPAAKRSCTARNRAQEAEDILGVLADRVAHTVAVTGKVPPVAAGPAPVASCCEQGGTCKPDEATWSAQGWKDLQFTIDGTYRYTYQYIPDPSGKAALLRAVGDLDCDGITSVYEVRLTAVGTLTARAWRRQNPYE